jgi:hypothetical protein
LNIHRINHDRTILSEAGKVIIPSNCGQQISSKWLALLSEQDVHNWVMGYSQSLIQQYGKRQQCRWCE